jgi:hypothetical protein
MELARIRLTTDGNRPIAIYPLGDIHLGAAACDIEHFRRTVRQIKADPSARWLGMGDYGDLIMPSDPRWSFTGLDWKRLGFIDGRPDVRNLGVECRDLVARELDPIKDQCIGIHTGNHEQAFAKHNFIDLAGFLASRFKAPYLGYTALTRLEIAYDKGKQRWTPVVFSEHGAKGGGTDGNAINSLELRGNEFEASVYLKGHVHKRQCVGREMFAWGTEPHRTDLRLATRDRIFILTGTYLKGYVTAEQRSGVDGRVEVTYGEYKGYPPNEIGGTVMLLEPHEQRIHAMTVEAYALTRGSG